MVRIIFLGGVLLFFWGCYKNVDGYKVDVTWKTYHILWEHPINLDSDEEQIIEVPFIRYGSYFSLCFDRERGNPLTLPDSELYLEHDSLEISFHIADTVLVGEPISSALPDYGCPINGRHLMGIHVPKGFDREKGGLLKFRVRKRHYLKNIPNARIVLAWGHPAAK